MSPLDLRGVAAFDGLGDAVIARIAERAVGLEYPKDAEIIGHMERSTEVFYVLSGVVRANIFAPSGRHVTYRLIGPGLSVGELSALDDLPRSLSVVATNEVFVARLAQRDFHDLVRAEPDFAMCVLDTLARLARGLSDQVYEYSTYDVKGRVYCELLRAFENGESVEITDRDMASRVGTTRENVSRIQSDLRKAGITAREGSVIRLLSVEHLIAERDHSQFT